VVFVKLPEVPLMVTVTVPIVAVLLAVSVSVLVLIVLLGLNDAVTPPGRPDADKPTLSLKPFCGVTVMAVEPEAPWRMVKLVGDAERVKLGCGEDEDQLLTKLAALTVPMPVAKSQPVLVP